MQGVNNPVIPAKAGASADGTSIQRKTKHTALPSPSRSVRGREWSEATFAGDARDGNKPVIPADATVIPAQAGIQRKTKHTALPSPFGEAKGRRRSEATAGGALTSPSMGEGQGDGEKGGQGAGADDQPKLDVEAARKSMIRMANIFAEIAKHAEDSSLTRCPYKDARSRCTAKFACKNQHFTKNPLNPPICTAKDGDLDYRSAWEID